MTQEAKYIAECVQCAKLIRADLKATYPGIKFRVNTHQYSGGNSINVYWTDGPTRGDVEALLGKYEDGDFDGMTDCYNYRENPDNIPRTKYLFCNRELSEQAKALIQSQVVVCSNETPSGYELERRFYAIAEKTPL